MAVATSPPFTPNIQKLSERTGLSRNTLLHYLYYLDHANVLNLLRSSAKGISMLQKPEKIYLENTNMLYAIAPTQVNIGTIRETFVLNHLGAAHKVSYPKKGGDTLINEKIILEIGGENKGHKQLENIENTYIIADDLDYVINNKISIWLLGLLY